MLSFFYDKILLAYPKTFLLVLLLAVLGFGYEARKLEIDASAETLILEDDKDLNFTRLVNTRYGSSDFLVISYIPHNEPGDWISQIRPGATSSVRKNTGGWCWRSVKLRWYANPCFSGSSLTTSCATSGSN